MGLGTSTEMRVIKFYPRYSSGIMPYIPLVVEFIHCNLKHEYFYGDYSIEWVKGWKFNCYVSLYGLNSAPFLGES